MTAGVAVANAAASATAAVAAAAVVTVAFTLVANDGAAKTGKLLGNRDIAVFVAVVVAK